MGKTDLLKYCKTYLVPYLKKYEVEWAGFDITTYDYLKKSNGNKYFGSGNFYKRPGGLALEFPSYKIYLEKFNNLFNPIQGKYDLGFDSGTVSQYDIDLIELSLCQKASQHVINSEETFLVWLDYFKEYWETYINPWFEKYSKLEAINELIDKIDSEGKRPQQWGISYQKKLLIFRICKNPKYSEYSKWYKEYHQEVVKTSTGKDYQYGLYALELLERCENGEFDEFEL